ncbi:MAG: hypothetical protein KAG97_02640 [Victivallales bacterium]|nr:hypothetical protein [Victivallales bacterium]
MGSTNKPKDAKEKVRRLEIELRNLRSRLSIAIFADAWLSSAAIAVFAGGGVLLVFHAMGVSSSALEFSVLAIVFLAPLAHALFLLRRRSPDKRFIAVLLAATDGCADSGLIAAYGEANVEKWLDSDFQLKPPQVILEFQRRALVLALGVVFLLGASFMPKILPDKTIASGLNISSDRASLKERMEMMEKERILENERAEELRKQLEEITVDAEGDNPEKTWEALDHLSDKLDESAVKAEEKTINQMTNVDLFETVAAKVSESAELDPTAVESALKGLDELLMKSGGFPPELRKMLKNFEGKFSADNLKKLLSKLGLTRKKLERLLEKIRRCESAKCRMERHRLCSKGTGGKVSLDDLKAFIESNCSRETAAALIACAMPGNEGISRGRGDAEMSWRKRELDFSHEFKAVKLNSASSSDLKESVLIGRDRAAPEKGAFEKSSSGAFAEARVSKRNTNGFVVRPRYRGAVRDYFENSE